VVFIFLVCNLKMLPKRQHFLFVFLFLEIPGSGIVDLLSIFFFEKFLREVVVFLGVFVFVGFFVIHSEESRFSLSLANLPVCKLRHYLD